MGLAKAVAHSSGGGLCVGRNVFQRPDPGPVLSRVRELLDS
jgi:DhnA family fructose-bisphosphate aldolase class Ia